jgi:two-component system chemotaxis response regulator CheB
VVGASTGGPKALASFVAGLDGKLDVPMLVTQHMPAMFTAILAEHLDRVSAMSAAEAVHKEAIKPGHIYVAPGGRHLVVRGTADEPLVELNDDPPENFCRPAVDPLFRTAANVFGAGTLGVVLTGMGSDGRQGARVIVDGGGTVLAQDRDSSVVWGMPGAVAMDGLCASVEPVNDLAQQVLKLSKGVRA